MDDDTRKIIEEQFQLLPKVVQEAINSTEMAKQFQALAQKHGLHVDQWDALENQIMLTVLGLAEPEELTDFAVKELGIEQTKADAVIDDVAVSIFKPIREEMERQLGSPEAKAEVVTDVDQLRNSVLKEARADGSLGGAGNEAPVPPTSAVAPAPSTPAPAAATAAPQSSVVPATPPAPPPTDKAIRAPISSSYTAQNPSTARKSVDGDPYREPIA